MQAIKEQYFRIWREECIMYRELPKTILKVGRYKGMQLRKVNRHYLTWLLFQPASNDTWIRLQSDAYKILYRKGEIEEETLEEYYEKHINKEINR